MPDIIITPSSGIIDFFPVSTRVGRIEGSGNTINVLNPSGYVTVSGSGLSINTSSPNALLHGYSSISGATILNLEGTNGSLFSVVDSLSGSLMSVNNNAGLPVFEVFSDDRVIGGRFGQNDFVITSGGSVGIGTSSPTSKLQVSGLITANSGNFTSGLTFNNHPVWHTGNLPNPVIGTGTIGLIPKWNTASGLVNSIITENSTTIQIAGSLRGMSDDTYLSFDAGSDRVGITKKNGFLSKFTYASGQSFSIAQSNTSNIYPAATFTDRLVVDSNGNVGIGTASPSTKLEILATGTANVDIAHFSNSNGIEKAKFSLSSGGDGTFSLIDNNNNTDIFLSSNSTANSYINNGGNFGVGTHLPFTKFNVGAKATTDNSYIYDFHSVVISHPSGVDTLNDMKELLVLSREGYIGRAAAASFKIGRFELVGTPPNRHSRTRLDLVLAHDSSYLTTPTTVLTALSNGNVGIGTISPSSALQVSGLITANSGNFTSSLQLNGSGVGLYDTSIFDLGTISGTNTINCGQDRQIQTITLNGTATTFTKGTGWPTTNTVARETTLNIYASGNTSITWTIVNDWYRQPDSPLPSGRHIVLLRSIGSGTMQGHYIGNKTN